jgi:folate-binding protein YgfZ
MTLATPSEIEAVLTAAAIAPLSDIGWLRITGSDRVRWLNGMVTNSIQDLTPGQGNYNFLLSAQGRIQGDANIFAQPDFLLLQSASAQIPNIITFLDRFIIMDDVELTDISATRTGLLLVGTTAATLLAQVGLPVADLPTLQLQTTQWQAAEVTLLHAYSPLVPRFELWADPAIIATFTQTLQQAGATLISESTLEALRLLEGTPRYGTDIRGKELPQETAQTRALHFAKGCYLGQEIVERIRSRGQVKNTLTALRLEGGLPLAGTPLEADGKPVGEITSAATIPLSTGSIQLALGYVRREALERYLPLLYSGGTALPVASPFILPVAG